MSDISEQRRYYERMIDDLAVVHREQLDQLKAENAKLREEIEAAKHDLSIFSGRIVELDAENAKLQEYAHGLELDNIRLSSDNCDLRGEMDPIWAENAKLREVAGIMAYCMQAERDCDRCRVNGGAGKITEPTGCDVLLDLLRELGVVADG